ncbi:MAG: serpin family protein [Bacteroidales bacterium]|nr:serpin family protein [Bacteroidales bacterium]
MKIDKIIFIGLFLFFITSSCEKKNVESVQELNPKKITLTEKGKQIISADNKFGFDLLKNITQKEETGNNIMISPTSVALALAMTYNGAAGTTKIAMEETLNKQGLSIDDINESYKYLIQALKTVDEKVTMSIANSIWYRDDFEVEQDFISTNQYYYDAEVTALNFADSDAKNIINNWVAEKTNNKISEIVNYISPETVMFLINAVYFKGIWHYEFNESETEELPFTLADGTVKQVETMSMKADLNYYNNNLFKAVELPYGQGNYTMVLFVPNNENTVNDIISELSPENWSNWISGFSQTNSVNVFLPKFTFEFERTLNDILTAMGMTIAFLPGEADFSKINPNYQLYISKVKHKTFIEVNEEGTEAAAVTSVEISYTCDDGDNSITVNFNRPFLFAIREVTTDAVVFLGKVENPE